jgi:hypothetical protein
MITKIKALVKKYYKSEMFWFSFFLIFMMTYAFIKSDRFYSQLLKGTKYQLPYH